jgi:hypothetical protein
MRDVLDYVSASGIVTNLTSLPGVRALGAVGMDMPPVEFVEDEIPEQPGTQLREVRTRPREVQLPLFVEQPTHNDLRSFLRALARRFDPASGDGRLRSTSADGVMRELVCRYSAGLEGSRTRIDSGATWRRALLVFRAFDPLWLDTQPVSQTYTTGAQRNFLGDPFLPIKLTSDTVFGEQTVDNDGDKPTFPVWTVHGPASSVRLTNVTTGQVIDLAVPLTAAQTVVIDTRPFRKTVRRDDGTNLYAGLSLTSALWPLPSGMSTVRVELPDATADSFVTLTYARRWLTA